MGPTPAWPQPPPEAASPPPRVAVVVPCHNEAATAGKVVRDFRAALPEAQVLVVDNASTDATAEAARQAGARVLHEPRAGKGFALLAGFREAKGADYFVMVDGDDTYPAEDVGKLLEAARAAVVIRCTGRSARPEKIQPRTAARPMTTASVISEYCSRCDRVRSR